MAANQFSNLDILYAWYPPPQANADVVSMATALNDPNPGLFALNHCSWDCVFTSCAT